MDTDREDPYSSLVVVGYVGLRRVLRPPWLTPGPLDSKILAISSCLTGIADGGDRGFLVGIDTDPPVDMSIDGTELVSLCLTTSNAVELFESIEIEGQDPDPRLRDVLQVNPKAPRGRILGYDVLGYEWGLFHSWLCHDLGPQVERDIGLSPRPDSLWQDASSAEEVAAYVGNLQDFVEPVRWLPYAIISIDRLGSAEGVQSKRI